MLLVALLKFLLTFLSFFEEAADSDVVSAFFYNRAQLQLRLFILLLLPFTSFSSTSSSSSLLSRVRSIVSGVFEVDTVVEFVAGTTIVDDKVASGTRSAIEDSNGFRCRRGGLMLMSIFVSIFVIIFKRLGGSSSGSSSSQSRSIRFPIFIPTAAIIFLTIAVVVIVVGCCCNHFCRYYSI
mmetsp:Transcript_33075/g.33527  ORF Transcript_33075/g.33527 Transcript_33075/m.33527 type:complete len:181 (+) Transcript_33075:163-705(+)